MAFIKKYILYIAWIQALLAMFGSLYFSDVRHWAPCILCWYQRICMYPLTLIIPIGILTKDKKLPLYVLPLSLIGTGVALFHYLLTTGVISEALAPCATGVSCITKVKWFGFMNIPFLSLAAFLIISTCMILYYKYNRVDDTRS